MITRALSAAALLLLTVAVGAAPKPYVDPDGAFALTLPDGWEAVRSAQAGQPMAMTTAKPAGAGDAAPKIEVIAIRLPQALEPAQTPSVCKMMLDTVVTQLSGAGSVISDKRTDVQFSGLPAIRSDIEYKEGSNTFKGWMTCAVGKKFVVLAAAYAPSADAAGIALADKYAMTLAVESDRAGSGGAPARSPSLLSSAALASVAGKIRANLVRSKPEDVLLAGEPPLTYGSIASFVQIIEICFGIRLTETEFETTKSQFIAYYPKADAQGKQILALGGANILKGLTEGSAGDRAKNIAEVKSAMAPRLEAWAKAGGEWAAVLWAAIQRRSVQVAAVKAGAQRPAVGAASEWKSEFSQGDLEASLEMLYFMWVAAGRSSSVVTAEAVQTIGTLLVQGFPRFPAEVQFILANAQKVYATMRVQWMQASAAQRQQLAAGYARTLDALGLTAPGAGGGGSKSAWSDVSSSDMSTIRAQSMMNSAFLASNSWYNTSH